MVAIYLGRQLGGHRHEEIGKTVGLGKTSSVSSAYLLMKERVAKEKQLQQRVRKIEEALTKPSASAREVLPSNLERRLTARRFLTVREVLLRTAQVKVGISTLLSIGNQLFSVKDSPKPVSHSRKSPGSHIL